MSLTDRERSARDAVGDALAHTDLGPWIDEGDHEPQWALTEWVAVSCWVNLEDGDSRIVRLGSADLLAHHRTGLLQTGLDTDWEEA